MAKAIVALVRFVIIIRYFCTWPILFLSKIVILGAISLTFGDEVYFGGPLNGAVIFIAVIITMQISEEIVLHIYHWIGRKPDHTA